ncbi:hypothetical protein BOX15_Mlig018762g2 [Macrostomum lignano]|uniref:EF-hand domain-containing protein n=2 Tax=Macrostomum lignano TaxID=282301 RepID=A0A267DF75_9PLAT|nr:hypothetical protein BOX15_Mlig018762g2 [Macrostomum lignano]
MSRLLLKLARPSAYGAAAALAAAFAATPANDATVDNSDKPTISWSAAARLQPVAASSTAAAAVARTKTEEVQPSPSSAAAAGGPAKPWQATGRNYRERRFLDFASVEFDGVPYMTPQDFLESVTQDRPRYRKRRRVYSESELSRILYKTPSRWWASNKLFRSMGDEGIISYSEYLFLLCILAKPKAGFEIAFKMIDLARNQRVDKTEFTILNKMMSRQAGELEAIDYSDVTPLQDTTLMLHFFGRSGTDKLDFREFSKFMTNLQWEVLEIEFTEFSKGLQTISESEFAQVLLRYTKLSPEVQEEQLQRVRDRLVREEGIRFEDFRLFFQFLNNLEDFSTALKMYSLAGHAINQEEFQRAVKACVGYTLAPHVVSTVFLLFDNDEDGSLSFHEFICILRDRLRGLNSRPVSADTPVEKFKRCVSQRLKDYDQ